MDVTDLEYKVTIPLRHTDIWEIDQVVEEIKTIRDWLDETTGWKPGHYNMRISVEKRELDVWFLDEKVAMLCILRWI